MLSRCFLDFSMGAFGIRLSKISSFLASRDECQGSLWHSPSVGVGVHVVVRVGYMDKNFNFAIGRSFQTIKDRAFIFHKCVPYEKTFHMGP